MKKILTLCIIRQHPKILLGMKKRGHGEGKWNGFGGKVERGETIEEATVRETKEEAGIEVSRINKLGILEFEYQDGSGNMEVHIFYVKEFKGSPAESEEMKPRWFDVSEIPYNQMWADDKYWLPMFLGGKKFKGKFLFDESNKIIDHTLSELN
ncbi:8-oxo-dGTP diphosphatase [Candidatus Parcubacteria bacterium]|nr:8-oxo-dGTP diphosphatase [Candidatus Parcubacteria bacterium]